MEKPILMKISGHHIADPVFLSELALIVRRSEQPVIIVHGGGVEITRMQELMGIEPQYVNGLRVTDAKTLEMVEMVLCGVVNKRLVRYLVNAGVNAMGMSGVDQGLIRAKPLSPDMGYTGDVESVQVDIIQNMLNQGITPVIAPVCIGDESNLNVNADSVASAIAIAVDVSQVIFVSNVAGILIDGTIKEYLTVKESNALIEDGTVFGGMIPKVEATLNIIASGVQAVKITNLDGLKSNSGTVIKPDPVSILK